MASQINIFESHDKLKYNSYQNPNQLLDFHENLSRVKEYIMAHQFEKLLKYTNISSKIIVEWTGHAFTSQCEIYLDSKVMQHLTNHSTDLHKNCKIIQVILWSGSENSFNSIHMLINAGAPCGCNEMSKYIYVLLRKLWLCKGIDVVVSLNILEYLLSIDTDQNANVKIYRELLFHFSYPTPNRIQKILNLCNHPPKSDYLSGRRSSLIHLTHPSGKNPLSCYAKISPKIMTNILNNISKKINKKEIFTKKIVKRLVRLNIPEYTRKQIFDLSGIRI